MGTLVCCKTHDEAGSQTQLSVRLLFVDPLVDLEHPIHDSDLFLLVIMNSKEVLGRHANGLTANLLGSLVVLVAAGLGLRSILTAAGAL